MDDNKKDMEKELRDILESEGVLTEEQVSRVESIEENLDTIESSERNERGRRIAEQRLSKRSFGIGDKNASVIESDTQAQYRAYCDWMVTGDSRALGDQTTTPDAAGGYLVPLDLQDEIVTKLLGQTGVRQAVDSRTYGFDVEIATVSDLPTITNFTGEGTAYDAVGVTFGNVRSYAFKSTAESYISEELMQDNRPSAVAAILDAHTQAHGGFWDKQFAVDGAGSASGPEALMSTATTGMNVHESETADVIVLKDLLEAYYETLPAQYRGESFSWVMHPTVEAVLRTEADGNDRNRLMVQSLATDAGVPSNNILGMPIIISTNAPTYTEAKVSASNVAAVMLTARSSYRIFDRLPYTTQRDEFSKGSEGKTIFRSHMRSDARWLAPYKSVAIKLKA